MRAWLHDLVLSFCPASLRKTYLPYSSQRVLLSAILTGPVQAIVSVYWLFSGYKALLLLRASQYGQILERSNETTQGWFAIIFFFEYVLFHPSALLLLYLALEGCVRFVGGVCVSEVVPSLPVVLAFKATAYFRARKAAREVAPLTSIPDSLEHLCDGQRLRITSSLPKPRWSEGAGILIRGEWYEVEAEEKRTPPRSHVYLLRPFPVGKIMRVREEHDAAAAVTVKATSVESTTPSR